MSINYSLSYRTVKVADLDEDGQKQYDSNGEVVRKSVQRAYATAQSVSTLSTDEFTRLIAAKGAYSRADILSIITIIGDCIENMLQLGQRVRVGDLGDFFPSISSKGVPDANDFSPAAHIKKAYSGWKRSSLMAKLRDVSYNLVNTKNAQTALNLANKGAQSEFTVQQSGSTQIAADNLELLRSEFTLMVNVKNGQSAYGSVSGSGEYKYGTYATAKAIPNDGYGFAQWGDGNEDNPREIKMTSPRSVTAEFYMKSGAVVNTLTGAAGAALHRGDNVTELHITGTDLPEDDLMVKGLREGGQWENTGMSWVQTDENSGKFTKSAGVALDFVKLRVLIGSERLITIDLPSAE